MPLTDILAAALSRPAARVVEAPVRELIHEVLTDLAYASPEDLQALTGRARAAEAAVDALQIRLAAAEAAVGRLESRVDQLDDELREARLRALAAEQARDAALQASAQAAPAPAPIVGPDGAVMVDGAPYRVSTDHAGLPYTVRGSKVRRVYIDGRAVRKQRA
jgi:hypothetical protein